MEVFWGVFILIMINQLINVYVLNQVIKDRKAIGAFVEAAKIYATAFEFVGIKQNDIISMVNKHTDLLQTLTDLLPQSLDEAVALIEARRSEAKEADKVQEPEQKSTDTE